MTYLQTTKYDPLNTLGFDRIFDRMAELTHSHNHKLHTQLITLLKLMTNTNSILLKSH